MRLSFGHKTGVASLLALVLLLSSTGLDAQIRSDVKQLLDDGISLFQQDKLAEARMKFEKVLLLDITSTEALDWIEEVGLREVIRIARSENDDLAAQASAIIRLSSVETRRRERDESLITEVLNQYFSGDDIMKRTRALMPAVSTHGVYLLPGLVERLAVPEIGTRVNAIQAISRISDDAVLPLTRVLHHDDSTVLLGAIASLKKIGNKAAVPSLKWLAETTSDQVVMGAAVDAITALDPSGMAASKSAYDLLVGQAGMFFRNSSYMSRTYHDPIIWKLDGGALGYSDQADWAINELRAEQLLADALGLDGELEPARVLNACNKFAQYTEFRAVRDLTARKVKAGQADESKLAEIRSQELEMNRIRYQFPASQPREILTGALARAMDERRPEVAIEVLNTIRDSVTVGSRASSVPSEIQRAQTFDHRGVRFAASECLARMNPSAPFDGSELVINNLAEGLVEAGARVALTIIPDQEDALLISGLLRMANLVSFHEATGWDGVQRAMSFPPEDLIVVGASLIGGTAENGRIDLGTAEVIARLRADYRTKDIPILVLSSDEDLANNQALYVDESNNVQVVNRSIDGNRLRDEIVRPLLNSDDSERDRGVQIATRAAEAIFFLTSRDTLYDLSAAEGALVTVLENRTDSVRIPAARALGALNVDRATPALVRICRDDSSSVDLLEAALIALGDINQGRGAIDETIQDVLASTLAHSDVRILKASSDTRGKIRRASGRQ